MSASVVIPAHNEEGVLRACLETLLDGLPEAVIVVVVCNGCTDATAEIASTFTPRITVLEIATASKPKALNVAEKNLGTGPRAFVDADVLIAGASVSRLLDAVRDNSVPAAEPHVRFDTSLSTFLVRAYYTVWVTLHGDEPGDIGGGVYCLSESGRHRFGQFPNVISDDGYVRSHFATGEIKRLGGTLSTVHAPLNLGSLIKIKTRSRLGTTELRHRFPELWKQRLTSSRSLGSKASKLPPRVWPVVPLYAALQMVIRVRARRQVRRGTHDWERDDTTRSNS